MATHCEPSRLNAQIRKDPGPDVAELCQLIERKSFCNLPAERVRSLLLQQGATALQDWSRFQESWSRLPLDGYMADGGHYRKRRHATLSTSAASLTLQIEPHQPHYQTLHYNPLNGGIARNYEPIENSILLGGTMSSVLTLGSELFGCLSPHSDWHIEVHQFRIEATSGEVAKPTPEGAHRDGVSFAMMLMVQRVNVVGGTTTIYDRENHRLDEFVLTAPFDMAIVNDERVRHSVTPIAPLDAARPSHRDVLVATFRHKLRSTRS